MNTTTPETDAESFSTVYQGEIVYADFARKLERERDELKNAINGLCEHFEIQPASATFLAVEILRMQGNLDEVTEILQNIYINIHDYRTKVKKP